MSDKFLNTHYVLWLKSFMEKNNSYSVRTIVKPLIAKLHQAQSLEELLRLLEQSNPPSQTNVHSQNTSTCYAPLNLSSQLSSWKEQLQGAIDNYPKAQQALDEVMVSPKIIPLMNILNHIMRTPKLQLHFRILSLIMCLSSPQFSEVVHFIANLEDAKLPDKMPSGSFLAQKSIDSDHAQCLILLNNVATYYDEKNKLWGLANSLLQTSLLIYQDSHLQTADLSDEASSFLELTSTEETDLTQNTTDNNSCCCILC